MTFQKTKKIKFRLFYKIFLLIALINLITIISLIYLRIRDYKIDMYNALLMRSATMFDFVIENLQIQIKSGTANIREPKPKDIISLFARAFNKDDASNFFCFYKTNENVLFYPEEPKLKSVIANEIQKNQNILEEQYYSLQYDPQTNLLKHYYYLVDNHKNYIGSLGFGLNTSIISKSINKMIFDTIIIGIFCLFISLILSYVFAKILLKPVQMLALAATAIAAGDLTKRAELITNDEIGELAERFNYMTQTLDDKINNLKALQLLSFNISSKLNREELSNIIVNTFTDIFNAEKSVLLLPDLTINKFVKTAAVGLDNATVWFDFNEGLLAKICASWNVEYTDSPAEMPEVKLIYGDASPAAGVGFLGVPFILSNSLRGIILILGEKVRLTDDNKGFLELLANHCMVALENARLYELAITDGLTGVYLKRYFWQKLEYYVYTEQNFDNLVVCMSDIDFFKKFNDSYGHQEGDFVLKEVAKVLKGSIRGFDLRKASREPDMLARYGGEEFCMLLFNVKTDTLPIILERIRKNIDTHEFLGEKGKYHVTVSIGAVFYEQGMTPGQLIECADLSLYDAKHSGRNQFKIYDVNKPVN